VGEEHSRTCRKEMWPESSTALWPLQKKMPVKEEGLMSDSSEKEAPCANAGRVRKGWCKTDGKHSESQSATNCYLQPGAAGEVETKVQIAYGKEGTEGGGFGDGKGPL